MLEALALLLAGVHFALPLAYYLYAKTVWLPKPWNLKLDEAYKPKATIILPTYNEARLIADRLDNIYAQDYPRELTEVIVIDSASTDGTPEIVEEWAKRHSDLPLKLIRESARRGKAHALNHALKHATGEVIVIADADALWPPDALSKAVKLLSDPTVGAVSCLKKPANPGPASVEKEYRGYYNVMRVAESKAYATPIFHGELAAFKAELLRRAGGFPTDVGADDSHTATKIALMGFRAIIPDDLWIEERAPKESYFTWRVRRAQHLLQHFAKILKAKRTPNKFKRILLVECYLHLVNPWLSAVATTMFSVSSLLHHSSTAIAMLAFGPLLLALKPYRTWMATTTLLEPEPSMLITGVGYAFFSLCEARGDTIIRIVADVVFPHVIDYAMCLRGLAV
ncbi:MAG: glycosyltransferase family 2 protein [Thermofilaceae archaeon]